MAAEGATGANEPRCEWRHLPVSAANPLPGPGRAGGGWNMKAARLHAYQEPLALDEVDEPRTVGPLDVVVRIGAAGLCRTDLHIQEGQWAEKSGVTLPYTLGHENAGWIHEVGSGVTNVEVGDTVIVHPYITCGLCASCRRGDDMHCVNGRFPGISEDGGFADFLLTSARSVIKLDPSLEPKDIAALADAGLTAIHAVKKTLPVLTPGTRAVVIGAGGLGHIGIQCLAAMTLAAQDKVRLHTSTYPLDAINDAMADLDGGRLQGRGTLVPAGAG